jgi:hypothetical protein
MNMEMIRLQRLDNGIEQLRIGIETMNEKHGINIESPTMILKADESLTDIPQAIDSPTIILKADEIVENPDKPQSNHTV